MPTCLLTLPCRIARLGVLSPGPALASRRSSEHFHRVIWVDEGRWVLSQIWPTSPVGELVTGVQASV